jgi:SAM-dependent methyltransferase
LEPSSIEFWRAYYEEVFANETAYLDYSNETVHLQTFAAALDGVGGVAGKSCLDVGCGWGQLSRVLHVLGAARVCAIDFQSAGTDALRRTAPEIERRVIAAVELELSTFGTSFDRIFMVEVLQYLDYSAVLTIIWPLLSPGGRVIAVVPNADNVIVKRTTARRPLPRPVTGPNPCGAEAAQGPAAKPGPRTELRRGPGCVGLRSDGLGRIPRRAHTSEPLGFRSLQGTGLTRRGHSEKSPPPCGRPRRGLIRPVHVKTPASQTARYVDRCRFRIEYETYQPIDLP